MRPAQDSSGPNPGQVDTLQPRLERISENNGDMDDKRTNHKSFSDDLKKPFAVQEGNDFRLPDPDDLDLWEPHPPKVLMNDPRDPPLELHSQIQLYATNESV